MDEVRIDKWLWAVRLFKTRTVATEACKTGKVKESGNRVKPSRSLQGGETLEIKKVNERMTVKVTGLIEKRVGYSEAIQHYELLSSESLTPKRSRNYFMTDEYREQGSGRPTKKDRRSIRKLKGR